MPRDVVVLEGDVAEVVCSVQGDVLQKLDWVRRSDGLVVTKEIEQYTIGHITTSVLTTSVVDSYYCVAEFESGHIIESSRGTIAQASEIAIRFYEYFEKSFDILSIITFNSSSLLNYSKLY